jgi:hypothetical protein
VFPDYLGCLAGGDRSEFSVFVFMYEAVGPKLPVRLYMHYNKTLRI